MANYALGFALIFSGFLFLLSALNKTTGNFLIGLIYGEEGLKEGSTSNSEFKEIGPPMSGGPEIQSDKTIV